VKLKPKSAPEKRFTFDRVFDPTADQKSVFDLAVAPVVDEALAGFSCTVFAYGQVCEMRGIVPGWVGACTLL